MRGLSEFCCPEKICFADTNHFCLQTTPDKPDIAQWLIKEFESGRATVSQKEKDNRLLGNAASVIVGGR